MVDGRYVVWSIFLEKLNIVLSNMYYVCVFFKALPNL